MQRLLLSVMTFVLIAGLGSGAASAKSCRDAHGKFVKCPTKMMAPKMMMGKPKPCRDAHGKFMKCKTSPMMMNHH